MIIINNLKFAECEKEFTDSLFAPDGTCCGYAKRSKKGIHFYTMQKEVFAFINHWGVFGTARPLTPEERGNSRGKIWYSYGIPEVFGEMGLVGKGYIVEKLCVRSEHTSDGRKYWFK
jgi:hypothetical protein